MSEFEDLLKPTTKESISSLKDEVQKTSGFVRDERFWYPKIDNDGGPGAIVRFLPHPPGEEKNFIKLYKHNFNYNGIKCFKYSPITLGDPDPIVEHSNENFESNEEYARKFWPQKKYYANIYVVEDKGNPDNVGKVFLWSFGQTVFNTLNSAHEPKNSRIEAINPYHLMDGADFLVEIHMKKSGKDTWPQYDRCKFLPKSPIVDGDIDKIKEIWKGCHSLEEFLKPENFPSYEDLEEIMDRVLKKEDKPTKKKKTTSEAGDVEEPSEKSLQDDLENEILNDSKGDPEDVLKESAGGDLDDLDLGDLDDLDLDDL